MRYLIYFILSIGFIYQTIQRYKYQIQYEAVDAQIQFSGSLCSQKLSILKDMENRNRELDKELRELKGNYYQAVNRIQAYQTPYFRSQVISAMQEAYHSDQAKK